jgi:hypothetical protein
VNWKTLTLAIGFAIASNLSAATIGIWSTGICSGLNTGCTPGSVLAPGVNDNNYQLISRADGGTTGLNSSITEAALGVYLADNVGASRWLAPNPVSSTETTGTYTYRTTFNLAGFVASSLVLYLDVSADNAFQVLVNGNPLNPNFTNANCNTSGNVGPLCYQVWTSRSITNAMVSGGWLPGLNTIDFVVTNNDSTSPTGLRVQAIGNADLAPIPEPATLSLIGFGLIGLGAVRRRVLR